MTQEQKDQIRAEFEQWWESSNKRLTDFSEQHALFVWQSAHAKYAGGESGCPLGDDCDLTVAYMAGQASRPHQPSTHPVGYAGRGERADCNNGQSCVHCEPEHGCRPSPSVPAQPEGYVLVPVEPTEEMQLRGAYVIRIDTTELNKLFTAKKVWAEMVAASQEQKK